MTRVDFYLAGADSGDAEGYRLTCRLAAKISRLGLPAFLLAADGTQARRLDDLLWTFEPESFVAHELAPDAGSDAPILIGTAETIAARPVLIKLDGPIPPAPERFERIAEVVGSEAARRAAARSRYGEYRRLGFPLFHHDM